MLALAIAAVSPFLAARALGLEAPGSALVVAMLAFGWLPAILLTDKYTHKYPQRYTTYLLSAHTKSALVMALAFLILHLIFGRLAAPLPLLPSQAC